MTRVFGYARVSTDLQSTALQLDALRAAGVPDANVFADDAVSGTTLTTGRRGFKALLQQLSEGDTLVVYSVSRVGRSTIDVLTLLDALGKRGVRFRSLTEPFDTTTAMGAFVLTILSAVAELERKMISQRTEAGMAAARARGAAIGRPSSASAKQRQQLLEAVDGGAPIATAARHVGLSESSARRVVAGRQGRAVG